MKLNVTNNIILFCKLLKQYYNIKTRIMEEESTILFNKEGLLFIKNFRNNYSVKFCMTNNNLVLKNIIDFPLIQLIYDLNSDICESFHMEHVKSDSGLENSNEIKFILVMKPLFEELGIPQMFLNLHIVKCIDNLNDCILFTSQSIHSSELPLNVPQDAQLLPIKNIDCQCLIISQNTIECSFNVKFDEKMNIAPIAEKLVGIILFKIFKRMKQFIETFKV